MLVILYGCNYMPPVLNLKQKPSNTCPDIPEITLKPENVENIYLGSEVMKKSNTAKLGQSIGYTFEAKTGQQLSVETKQNICFWVYSPENKILTNTKNLPNNGKYIIQIAALEGSTTFDLSLGLDVVKASEKPVTSVSTASVSTTSVSNASKTVARPAPDEFIKNHYTVLNNRDYRTTWSQLSPQFQSISGNFSNYVQWWDSVRSIKLISVNIVNNFKETAIVDVNLEYVMNTGLAFYDNKPRIYLIWDESSKNWKINKKSA